MAASWSVVDQRQTSELGSGGRFMEVWEVTYRTPEGIEGSVRIPKHLYAPDYVASVIDEEVARVRAVSSL